MVFVNLIFFAIACISLALGGYLVVKGLTKLIQHYDLKEFVVGFIIMAVATSIPELFVGISSALKSIPALSFGDVIGSNIVDLTLVVGMGALIGGGIRVDREIRKDILYTWIIAMLPLILFLDHELSRIDGIVLLSALSLYIFRLIKHRKVSKTFSNGVSKKQIYKEFFIFIIGLIILLVSAKFIVDFASFLLLEFSLPAMLIGLIVVSLGTSLPELSFEVISIKKGFSKMALGDLFGSVAINSTLVLGIVSIIYPIEAYFPTFVAGAVSLLIGSIFLMFFAKTEREITRKEGLLLLIVYVIFISVSLISGVHIF